MNNEKLKIKNRLYLQGNTIFFIFNFSFLIKT